MTQLTAAERTDFYEKATAFLAHREQLELIAEGGRSATQNEILSPFGELARVLRAIRTRHPELQALAFRGRLFILPNPKTDELSVQVLRLDRVTTVEGNGSPPRREDRTFDEILAPFRQSVAESGMTDEELDALFQEAREEVWQQWQQTKKQ
jgi:hypothetical protein